MAEIFNGRKEIKYSYGRFGTATQTGRKSSHFAYDLTCPDQPATATEVFAVEGGTVVQSRIVNNGVGSGAAEWGNYVTILTTSGFYDTYAHLASRAVAKGQKVASGAKIGVMGNTGNAAYAANPYRHVHFERRKTSTGSGVDATAVLGIQNAVGIYGTIKQTNEEDNNMYRLYKVTFASENFDAAKAEFDKMVAAGERPGFDFAPTGDKYRVGKSVMAKQDPASLFEQLEENYFIG